MLNYMRSEFYRIFHSRTFYMTIAVFMGLPIAVNGLLLVFVHNDAGFPYAITSFSYSNFVANPMWMAYSALLVSFILYDGTRKNGTLKNVVALGVERHKIFIGQCIVATAICGLILLGTLITYTGSAELLLQTAGPILWRDLFETAAAGFLIAVSSVVLSVAVLMLVNKEWGGILVWLAIFEFFPLTFFLLGLKFVALQEMALWMPKNFFNLMHSVGMSNFEPIWQTADGLERCLVSGLVGIVVFGLIGIWRAKKMEI